MRIMQIKSKKQMYFSLGKAISILLIVLTFISSLSFSFAYADIDAEDLETIIEKYKEEKEFKIRGYLQWGMNVNEVKSALEKENHIGKRINEIIDTYPMSSNSTVTVVKARTVLGDDRPMMYCIISDLWGLIGVTYDYGNFTFLSEEEWTEWKELSDDDFLAKYERIEKTINYVYGMRKREISNWYRRQELPKDYLIISSQWSVGRSKIVMKCYKSWNNFGYYCLFLEYRSPDYDEYNKILEEELEITGKDMFYGY